MFHLTAHSPKFDLSTVRPRVVFAAFAFFILGGLFASNAAAQSALDGFDPNGSGAVYAVAAQPDGKTIVGGDFYLVSGTARNRVARLNADGSLDAAFNPNASNTVYLLVMQPDGRILAGGSFVNIGGQSRNRIARLNADGTLDAAFNPNANGLVYSFAAQSDGRIIIGGNFTSVGGATRNYIARLNADGTLDAAFDPNANGNVISIAAQSDGKILAGGSFTAIGGATRNYIARLNSDGTSDTFDPNANNSVRSLAVQPDGKILVGGDFTGVGGQSRNFFARLSNDTAAISALSVTRTSVTLTRNGSAAQFTRVLFEQSTDNGATYTALGTATSSRPATFAADATSEKLFAPVAPQAAGYTLTGLNLPTGQNILVRARGYYRSGYFSGSETTEDKVQNAFFAFAPTAASVSISGRVITPLNLGLAGALVTLTNMQGESRTVFTGKAGRFTFTEVAAGETYILSVRSKRYRYAPQVITVTEDMTEVNFTAQ